MSDTEPSVPTATTKQKLHAASPYAALIAILPTLLIAWQSGKSADDAKDDARDRADSMDVEVDRQDNKLLRAVRRAMREQDDAIDDCHADVLEMGVALEDLYEHVAESQHTHKPGRVRPEREELKRWEQHTRADKPPWAAAKPESLPLSIDELE